MCRSRMIGEAWLMGRDRWGNYDDEEREEAWGYSTDTVGGEAVVPNDGGEASVDGWFEMNPWNWMTMEEVRRRRVMLMEVETLI